MYFVTTPNLPEGKVCLAVSQAAIKGVQTLRPPKIAALKGALARHADLGLLHLGGNRVVCPPDTFDYYRERLSPFGFEIIRGERALDSTYPGDTAYNVAILKEKVLLNPKTTDKAVLNALSQSGAKIIAVRQGYSKCAVCAVSENAIITEDGGISRAAAAAGIDTLLIRPRGVRLLGFENGFFGGSCGKISSDTLAVCGDISLHPDREKILSFLDKYHIRAHGLRGGSPRDIGSIIPLLWSSLPGVSRVGFSARFDGKIPRQSFEKV